MASTKKRAHPFDDALEPTHKKIKTTDILSFANLVIDTNKNMNMNHVDLTMLVDDHTMTTDDACETLTLTSLLWAELPLEILERIYSLLSSDDHWHLYQTHASFQPSLSSLIEQFKVTPLMNVEPVACMSQFPHLKKLTIERLHTRAISIKGDALPSQLESLTLPSHTLVHLSQLSNFPITLTKLVVPTVMLTFEQQACLPCHLKALTTRRLQVDQDFHFNLPNQLNYLHVLEIESTTMAYDIFPDQYYGLPESLLQLYAPFPGSYDALQLLPRGLLKLSSTVNYSLLGWIDHLSVNTLPPQLEVLDFGKSFLRFNYRDLNHLPTSLTTLSMSHVQIFGLDIDDDGHHMEDAIFDLSFLDRLLELKSLTLGIDEQPLSDDAFDHLPSKLVALDLSVSPSALSMIDEVDIKALPSTLINLSFHNYLSIPTNLLNLLPTTITDLSILCEVTPFLMLDDLSSLKNLRYLRLGCAFDVCSLSFLPEQLERFELEQMHSIDDEAIPLPAITRHFFGALPRLLKRLAININQSCEEDEHLWKYLPSTLIELDLPHLSVHPNVFHQLPKTLKYLHTEVNRYEVNMFDHLPSSLRVFKNSYRLSIPQAEKTKLILPPSLVDHDIFLY